MRMDLSREEEAKKIPSELVGLASIAPAAFAAFSAAQTAVYTPLVAADKAKPLIIEKPSN